MDATGQFHDGCLREMHLSTETFFDDQGYMHAPGHLDSRARLRFQVCAREIADVELEFHEILSLVIAPTAENADSILNSASVECVAGVVKFRAWCVGLPLVSEPNSVSTAAPEEPFIEITSRKLAWRSTGETYSQELRYGPSGVA